MASSCIVYNLIDYLSKRQKRDSIHIRKLLRYNKYNKYSNFIIQKIQSASFIMPKIKAIWASIKADRHYLYYYIYTYNITPEIKDKVIEHLNEMLSVKMQRLIDLI